MSFSHRLSPEYTAALRYQMNDYALMLAIADRNIHAIIGLVKYFDNDVNCEISGGGFSGMAYMYTRTPLSYALSHDFANVVKTLLDLGAIKQSTDTQSASYSDNQAIRDMFGLPPKAAKLEPK